MTMALVGFAYFSLDQEVQVAQIIAQNYTAGYGQQVLASAERTPFFKGIQAVPGFLLLAIFGLMAFIGLVGLFAKHKTWPEFFGDIGKNLYTPAVGGVVLFFVIQLLSQQMVFSSVEWAAFVNPVTYDDVQFKASIGLFIIGFVLQKIGKKYKSERLQEEKHAWTRVQKTVHKLDKEHKKRVRVH